MKYRFLLYTLMVAGITQAQPSQTISPRIQINFNKDWRFNLGETATANTNDFDDASWRKLDLPHDWSIEGAFDEKNPAGVGGGALPGGIGWYRKTFTVPLSNQGKLAFIAFDGIYRNSEVWINGHFLGKRPNGYISFQYELTPYLKFGNVKNVLTVKVENSKQPNSRWYSGSGIYRNVWLAFVNPVHVDQWGTYITASLTNNQSASIRSSTTIKNASAQQESLLVTTRLLDGKGKETTKSEKTQSVKAGESIVIEQDIVVTKPSLWSVEHPNLYTAVTELSLKGKIIDRYETPIGIRYFTFDSNKGFFLNGEPLKINGVCNHHDLGCLGTAINIRALQRQLEIMRGMGG